MSLKKGMVIVVAVAILGGLFGVPHFVWAEDKPGAEEITFDFFIARPLGILSVLAGGALFVVTCPAALITGSTKTTAQKLVFEPCEFTFDRPLGEF